MNGAPERLQAALAGRYQVERELGRGGMATVYLAQDLRHRRPVALKVLHPDLATALGPERFLREIEITARLQHPHILPLLDSGEAGGFLYYVMPYVEGESLRQRLEREKQLPLADALRIAGEVAGALDYAHQRDVVHRDIKPENVLLSGPHALVADFGIARALEAAAGAGLTQTGMLVGTPGYMSPEQALGSAAVDARSDVYALGCLLYEMLAGQPPFTGPTAETVLHQHLSAEPAPVTRLRPMVPAGVTEAIQRALAKAPADRFSTAVQLAAALEAADARRREGSAVPPATGAARRQPRLRWVSWAAVALTAIVAGGLWLARQSPPANASTTAIAVMPFAVRGSAQLAYLGEGMMDLLSATLDGAGDVRSADPHAVLAAVTRLGRGPVDPERARKVAERLGAGRYVLGNVVQSAGRLRVFAALYDASRGVELSQASVEGPADSVFALVDGLAGRLLANQRRGPGARISQLAALTTRSLPALRSYLEGETAFRAGRFDGAVEAFQRAVDADTSFALAHYRLSLAAEWTWTGSAQVLTSAAERAVRHSARLSDRDRRLLEAFLTWRRGAAEEAERLYRDILRGYPEEVEAWAQLGEVLFHYRPLRGGSIAESREPFERVLFYDPGQHGALLHLARLAAIERDRAELDSLTRVMLRLYPESERVVSVSALRGFTLEDRAEMERVRGQFARSHISDQGNSILHVAIYAQNLPAAAALARSLLPSQTRELEVTWRAWIAEMELAQGRWRAAKEELALAEPLGQGWATEFRALMTLSPFLDPPQDELEFVRAALLRWDAKRVPPATDPLSAQDAHDGLHEVLKQYLLGRLGARLGQEEEVRRASRALAGWSGDSTSRALAGKLALALGSLTAPAPAALASLERARIDAPYTPSTISGFFAQSHDRFHRAALLESQGRHVEALRCYGSFEGAWVSHDMIYLAPSHLRRAEIHERLNQPDKAVHHYGRFIELWKDCDRELRPLVEDARRRRERLLAQSG